MTDTAPLTTRAPRLLAFATLAVLTLLLTTVLSAHAKIKGEEIIYKVDGQEFLGYMAWDTKAKKKRPGVLVVHEWWGHNDYSRERARKLAKLGYTAFALDMYGKGKLAEHPKDATAFMNELLGDLPAAEKRFAAAYQLLANHHTVKGTKIAAIGYCLGGGTVLYMARRGVVPLSGVVSFHGALAVANQVEGASTGIPMQVYTGQADPFVSPEEVGKFVTAMNSAGQPFTLKAYPGVKHSFTVADAAEKAAKFEMPLAYDKAADKDSWAGMQRFFDELF